MRQRSEPEIHEHDEATSERAAPQAESGESLVELVLAEHAERQAAPSPPRKIHGVVIGRFEGLGPAREVQVDFPGNPSAAPITASIGSPSLKMLAPIVAVTSVAAAAT